MWPLTKRAWPGIIFVSFFPSPLPPPASPPPFFFFFSFSSSFALRNIVLRASNMCVVRPPSLESEQVLDQHSDPACASLWCPPPLKTAFHPFVCRLSYPPNLLYALPKSRRFASTRSYPSPPGTGPRSIWDRASRMMALASSTSWPSWQSSWARRLAVA